MKQQFRELIRAFLMKQRWAMVRPMLELGRERRIDVYTDVYTNEYLRLSQLELAVHEIYEQQIPGAVAELGVYQGHFAAILNAAFPDRKLYLFDTFAGFDAAEEQKDRTQHGMTHDRDFTDTSVERVLGVMPGRQRCVVRKGLFPATVEGLENERFCFVSIDTDLYDPILAGLQFFYDRLTPGGFIFVHDYNNAKFPGARAAVREYAAARGAAFVPITDPYGTAVFRRA
jgi:O-methyltransferase